MASGKCGEKVMWRLEGKILTISGEGKMFNNDDMAESFSDNGIVEQLVIEAGVTAVGNFAFGFCDNLRRAELPDSVVEIGTSAFVFCGKLAEIKFSANVVTIGKSAFCGCWSLAEIRLPESLIAIGEDAFTNCSGLRTIKIPGGVKEIRDKTFQGCEQLEKVTLPAGLKKIGSRAFAGCESLTEIKIPAGVVEVGEEAFAQCANLKTIYCAPSCGFEEILSNGNDAQIIHTTTAPAEPLWHLDGDTLTITDADILKRLAHDQMAPWFDKRDTIRKIIIETRL